MVKINHFKSKSGLDNCFELWFAPKEERSELEFFLWLFRKHNLFKGSAQGKEIIWSIYWDCEINGLPFTMIYDKDYDFVSFSVDEKDIPYRESIAEAIKQLIDSESF